MNELTAGTSSRSGQNAEEATELLATMRLEHPSMKSWYNNPNNHNGLSKFKIQYEEVFPTFWQDLIKWQGWKAVRREYLLFQENGGKFSSMLDTDTAAVVKKEESEELTTQQMRGRRRKRWGDAGDEEGNGVRARKSRWAESDPSATTYENSAPLTVAAADPVMAALGLSSSSLAPNTAAVSTMGSIPPIGAGAGLDPRATVELTTLQSRLRLANARLSNLDIEATRIDALPRDHPDRSPSPPPVYGPDGTRKNTRANRWREKYTEERTVCLESIMELIPSMRPPGFISKRKRSRRIDIPIAEFPTYNFIGLIIGPRGKTQKDMENKTGCKIAIRGKGSIKEGAKGRRNGVPMDGDDEPLHVLITGDDPAAIDAAAEMVESMLVVIDDEKNVHKQNQLRELALLNGTLKDEEWCHVCGEKGHKDFECPKRFALGNSKNKVVIKCAICGDTSHPTRDCKVAPGGQSSGSGEDQAKAKLEMDADYSAFMAELDGRPVDATGDGGGDVSLPSAVNVGGGSSFCTTIQAARVVIPGGGGDEQQGEQGEVVKPTIPTLPPAMTGNGDSWITTISSNVMTTIRSTKPVDAISSNVTTISATKPVNMVNPPTSTDMSNGILTSILELASAKPAAGPLPPLLAGSLPPPPPPPQPHVLRPPPPPQQQFYNPYQQYQQQPQYNPYQQYPQQLSQYGAPPPPPYGQPPPPVYGAPPMQQHQWNLATSGSGTGETAGWDPNSYYGASNEGAGGFNWWDQSSDD